MFLSPRNLGYMLLPLFVAVAPTPSAVSPAAAVEDDPNLAPQASRQYEVRLRKLHLVRPDLIPYPIAYEVHC